MRSVGKLWSAVAVRFENRPLDSPEALSDFIRTRAAYVAQTSLYGYLKTRMGTRYVSIFQDETFAASINLAKAKTYIACLADLTVFAVATAGQDQTIEDDQRAQLARYCFERILGELADKCFDRGMIEGATSAFIERLAEVSWSEAALGEGAFTESPGALYSAAPIADELKVQDRKIVTNSIRFRWRDVRTQLRKRIDGETLFANWQDGK